MHQSQSGQTLRALLLVEVTILAGLMGSCVGFIWGLSMPPTPEQAVAWALGWTAIGGVQGACAAPAYHLGRGSDLGALCRLVLSLGGAATTLLALLLFIALGQSGRLSLGMALGLCVSCTMPLCAYLFGRREIVTSVPASL